jgi:rRNA maturation RNase YbeY
MPSINNQSKVQFHYGEVLSYFKNRNKLKKFLETLFRSENKKLNNIQYIFCSDEYLLNINKEFLQHDYFTDIVSFDLSQSKLEIIGEIYISIDRVKDNAREFDRAVSEELHRVIFHGALHLCGYKDKTRKEQEEMRAREDHYLKRYFKKVPRGTRKVG